MNPEYYLDKASCQDLELSEYYLTLGLCKFPESIELRYEYSKLFLLQHRYIECLYELELIERLSEDYRDVKQALVLLRRKMEDRPMNIYG